MRILVFTTDVIPLRGLPTSGTAMRTWGMAKGLECHGHEVVFSVPKSALQGLERSTDLASLDADVRASIAALKALAFDPANQSQVVSEVAPDAILCGHWPAVMFQTKPSQPLIVDLAGPHLLERHYQGTPNHSAAVVGKLHALAKADSFIVSGPKQRLYFLSFLLRAGVPDAAQRISTITMPLPPPLPERAASSAPAFPQWIFGGVFLPWQDPSWALEGLASQIEARGRGRLTLIGGSHPSYPIKSGVYEKLFRRLDRMNGVERKPMMPYEQFCRELQSADVAIDVMAWNLERELAITIRTTSFLWAGVPVVYNNYADLGALIERFDAGWTVAPGDDRRFAAITDEIFSSPETVLAKSRNATRLAREIFSWDRAVEPLLGRLLPHSREAARETDIILDFPDDAGLAVTADSPIEQRFLARLDGLSRIECRLATHGRSLRSPLVASVFRVGADTRDLVVRAETAPGQVRNNDWHVIELPPLGDSAGAEFILRLESSERDPAFAVCPWAVKGQPYPLLGIKRGGADLPHTSLCLRTTCSLGGA